MNAHCLLHTENTLLPSLQTFGTWATEPLFKSQQAINMFHTYVAQRLQTGHAVKTYSCRLKGLRSNSLYNIYKLYICILK